MSDKIFDDYHGASIKINGVCYKFVGETTSSSNSVPGDIEGFFASCLECALESSSSSLDSSSSSSENFSESSSSSFVGVPLEKINCDSAPQSGYPQLKMTLCWSGGGTKTFLGKSWTNGESKLVCPDSYDASWMAPTANGEYWRIDIGSEIIHMTARDEKGTSAGDPFAGARLDLIVAYSTKFVRELMYDNGSGPTIGYNQTAQNFSNVAPTTLAGGWGGTNESKYTEFKNLMFGNATATAGTLSGVTFKWKPVSGTGWKNTSLSFVPNTGNEACP